MQLNKTLLRLVWLFCLVSLLGGCVYSKGNTSPEQQATAHQSSQLGDLIRTAATLGQDDVFEVRVFNEENLSSIYRVSDKGTIAFPLIGDVQISGKTPSQIESEIQQRLEKDYLKKAYVSVYVKEFNSQKIFVFGQVQKPGTFRFEENMTIIQAITMAGGYTNTAAKSEASITRIVDGSEKRIDVEVDLIWKGKQPNVPLQPGDIIFIPEALF